MIVSVYPPEDPAAQQEDVYTVEDALKDCQADYANSQLEDRLTKTEYNKFCECYIYRVAEIFDDEEIEYQHEHDKPSSQFIKETERLADLCIAEVEG